MASLKQIRGAVKTTLETHLAGVTVHRTVPGSAAGIIVVVAPADDEGADFLVAMNRGQDTYRLDLTVLVPASTLELRQDQLDDYVTGAGDKSIRQVVFTNRTLGLPDTDAHVSGMSGYGADYSLGATQYLGAVLRLIVHTEGNS